MVTAISFNFTCVFCVKPDPFTVNATYDALRYADVGEMDSNVIVDPETVTVCDDVMPPPGADVKTVTSAVPGVARSDARIVAFNCVSETNVVSRLLPFHCTTDVEVNPDPFTVIVESDEPLPIVVGDKSVRCGTGLFTVIVATCDTAPVPLRTEI